MGDPGRASLTAGACIVLTTADARAKAKESQALATAWRAGDVPDIGRTRPLDRPARPERPILLPPRDMPRRRAGRSRAARIALLHALAHIELNAIDLAWDMIARFAAADPDDALPRAFCDDWVGVADDEARHFLMIDDRLADFDTGYGALPAHDGLWQAARETSADLLARLAVVPMVLEARGLDVTPTMIDRLEGFGDEHSAALLRTIYADEITHVAAGCRWFHHVCAHRGLAPTATWQTLVSRHFKGVLKAPFNESARRQAGLPAAFYTPLAG